MFQIFFEVWASNDGEAWYRTMTFPSYEAAQSHCEQGDPGVRYEIRKYWVGE